MHQFYEKNLVSPVNKCKLSNAIIPQILCKNQKIFDEDLDTDRIIQALKLESGVHITPQDTLIIFDEIQECPNAVNSLKYFCEDNPSYHVVCAGSLLGLFSHSGYTFPVGKVEYLNLFPLNFYEFLDAIGEDGLSKIIREKDTTMVATFHDKIIRYLKEYYYIGGMPEVVSSYVSFKNYNEVREIQERILSDYKNDFSKHAPIKLIPKVEMIWDNISTQLSKENKKFMYVLLKKGARAKEYEDALWWLIGAGLIYKIYRTKNMKIPLSAYKDYGAFKIYFFDVGLLAAKSHLDGKTIIDGNRVFTEFKGSLTENYVLNEILSNGIVSYYDNLDIFYWTNDNSTSEIDFITQYHGGVMPIEVKAEKNLKAKSFKNFIERYKTMTNIRTSMNQYKQEDWVVNIPLYSIGSLPIYVNKS